MIPVSSLWDDRSTRRTILRTSETMAQRRSTRRPCRERKRAETRRRIADEAARLASEHGIPATTADEIARPPASAGPRSSATSTRRSWPSRRACPRSRSSSSPPCWPNARRARPARGRAGRARRARRRPSTTTVRCSSSRRCCRVPRRPCRRGRCTSTSSGRSPSPTLVAPRFDGPAPGDPRPRMVGALTMAAARLACDEWVADGGRPRPDQRSSSTHLARDRRCRHRRPPTEEPPTHRPRPGRSVRRRSGAATVHRATAFVDRGRGAATGLDDFGEPSWQEGLDLLPRRRSRATAQLNEIGVTRRRRRRRHRPVQPAAHRGVAHGPPRGGRASRSCDRSSSSASPAPARRSCTT